MKRSNITRRSPMKRTSKRMNAVSKTNSKPHRDASVVQEYRESHARCLLCGDGADHVHHIFGGSRARVDVSANLAALCWKCHGYVHTDVITGKIDCLYGKLKLKEFDAAALDAMGSERIAGWLARNQPGPGTLLGMWAKLVGECE